MDKATFIERIKALNTIKSVNGIEYRIDDVDDKYIEGTRLSTGKSFKIPMNKLYQAYSDLKDTVITTSTLKPYVDRVQSPSLAILKAIAK
ncbi:MAG: hypothetical protein K2J63_07610 [Muribaculaceae bacterium]|nr:hypothetical protein [Muribaculaceae bacterium]